jgi:A/G-specific adenine glycosylase
MLQQTQVPRVVPKYLAFLYTFPSFADLAASAPSAVLSAWQGLGYNRRALALHRTAIIVQSEYGGILPASPTALERLPGIGHATAAAICAYAFDKPLPFIETNVRSAFIHFFFRECTRVSDADILPLVELALDRDHPRDWYYALMDYGTWVKKNHPNPSRKSEHHKVPTVFAGSRRQARAAALRVLVAAAPGLLSLPEIVQAEPLLEDRGEAYALSILEELRREGFLMREADRFRIG